MDDGLLVGDASGARAAASPAAGFAGAIEPSFPGWGLTWRTVVSAIGVISVVAAPWAGLWFYRWFAGRIALPGGRRLRLEADLRETWPLFVAMGAANWSEDALGETGMTRAAVLSISVLIEAGLTAWLFTWLLPRLRSDDDAARLGFEGSFLGLAAWVVLLYVGIVSLIGWAWALKNMLRWIARRTAGPLAFDFHATGFEVLWRTLLFFLLCAPVVTIPWAFGRWTNWILAQISAEPRAAPP